MSAIRTLVLVLLVVLASSPVSAQLALPSDVLQNCTVSPGTFASWFVSGSPSPNGAVKVADSVDFPTSNTVCDFYTWGAQMFLWLTSPSTAYGGGSSPVLNSPAILNVLPANSSGVRHFQLDSGMLSFAVRAEKFDDIGELAQAGSSGVLMSQQESLVYYGVHVNQLYAFFLTGQKNGQISATVFPRNSQDEATVVNYARNAFPGVPVLDSEGLAIELKTSWVDAATVPDRSQFFTMEAVIPTFSHDSNTKWTESGPETVELALVGLHVVGTVQNHPEFVWITYEHILNAPDADYYYYNSKNEVTEQGYDSSGQFLFIATNSPESPANVECMKVSGKTIVATSSCAGGIVPSNTVRTYPWGSLASSTDTAVVTNNPLLLSINDSIRSQLIPGDVRANYIQTGGIWTSAPSATSDAPIPNTTKIPPPYDPSGSQLRGSLHAFNATMETYTQGTHCFSCHALTTSATNSFGAFQLSHIYSQIVPLPTGWNGTDR